MKRLIALLLASLVAGCSSMPPLPSLDPQPSPTQMASPDGVAKATAVKLPIAGCKQQQVQHPARPGMNARVALRLTNHALSRANGRILHSNSCLDDVAAGFARGLTH